MFPYSKHMRNLVERPLGSTNNVRAIGYIDYYGQEKLVVKLDDAILYQGGHNFGEQKEQLTAECKIIITSIRLNNSTKRQFAVCKVVQPGDITDALDYEKVPLLHANRKRSSVND